MKKYFSLLVLILVTAFFGLAGCGDIYADMRISASETEMTLYLGGTGDDQPAYKTMTATVSGISDESVSNKLAVVFDDPKVASAGEWTYDGDVGTVTIYAQSDGTTNMYIKSLDNSLKVTSSAIVVTVIEPVTAIAVDDTVKGSVIRGGSLNLSKLGNIDFEPITTSQTNLEFYFYVTTGSGVTGNRTADSGKLAITVDTNGDYILTATDSASLGLVTLIVRSNQVTGFVDTKLVKTFDIMVYEGFSSEDIQVKNVSDGNAASINSLKLVENYDGSTGSIIYNQKTLSVSVNSANGNFITTNLEFDIVPNASTLSNKVDIDRAFGTDSEFVITAKDSGQTTYDVTVYVMDNKGNVYVTVTKTFTFTIVRAVTDMTITSDDGDGITQPNETANFTVGGIGETSLNLNVFSSDSYATGVMGSQVTANVTPTAVENTKMQIQLSEVNIRYAGSTSTTKLDSLTQASLDACKQYIRIRTASGAVVNFGDEIRNDIPLYISFDSNQLGNNVLIDFTISFLANYDADMPTFAGSVYCLACESVGNITAPDDLVIKVDDTKIITFSSGSGNVYNTQFNFIIGDKNLATYTENDVLSFIIKGLSQGKTTLTVQEKNTLVSASINITVVELSNYMWITSETQNDNSGVSQVTYDMDNPVYDDTSDANADVYTLSEVVVKTGTRFNIQLNTNPTNATIKSTTYSFTKDDGKIIVVNMGKYEDNVFQLRTSSLEGTSNVSIVVTSYTEDTSGIIEKITTLTFNVVSYSPIVSFGWNSAGTSTISAEIYDLDSLSSVNQLSDGIGYITLKPYLYSGSSRTYDISYGFTTSEYDDTVHLENVSTVSSDGVKISANLGRSGTANVRVYATINDYGRPWTIYCDLTISQPTQVNEIRVLKYDTDVYLEAGASTGSSYSEWSINTIITPTVVYDDSLSYVLYRTNGSNVYYAVYTVKDDDISVQYFSGMSADNIPLSVVINNGVPTLVVNDSMGVDEFEDNYYLRVMPSSLLNVAITQSDWESKFADIIVYKDLTVIIGKGTETNPYRILTEEDLKAIQSKGFNKNYELMQDVKLSDSWTTLAGTFIGSLSSHQYSEDVTNFIISGLYFNVQTTVDTESNIGLFNEIGTAGVVKNIDIKYKESTIGIDNEDNLNTIVRFGLLAGVNRSSYISNVSIYPTTADEINLNVGSLSNRTLYVGGLFGDNSGALSNISGTVNIVVDTSNNANLLLYVGGMLGKNTSTYGTISTTIRPLVTANINVTGSTSVSGIGGLVGDNTGIIKFIDIVSSIYALNLNQVGGIAGINSNGSIEDCIATPIITANNYVGGAVGNNLSTITKTSVELAYNLSATEHTSITGNDYVGGLVGKTISTMTLNYVVSYAPLILVDKSQTLESGQFYGDIVGRNYVGGLAGSAENALIQSCFAEVQIGVYNVNANSAPIVGGLVGSFISNNVSKVIQYAYAITNINVTGASRSNVGGFVGQVTSSGAKISQCYSVLNKGAGLSFKDTTTSTTSTISNFVGSLKNSSLTEVAESSYYADSTVSATSIDGDNTDAYGAQKRTYAEMQGFGNDSNTYTAWTESKWMAYSDTIGFNDELPILVKSYSDNEWLFYTELSYIRIQHQQYLQVAGNVLPTFWTYSYEGNSIQDVSYDTNLKMVVVLENLGSSQSLSLTDLVDVQTSITDLSKLHLKVESSDTSIVSIQQRSSSYDQTTLLFNRTGTVIISIYSLQDSSVCATFQICVIGGFTSYELLNESGDEIQNNVTGDYVLSVILGENTLIYPTLTASQDYNDSFGMVYYLATLKNGDNNVIAYFKDGADNIEWAVDNRVYVLIEPNVAHWIYGNARQIDAVVMTANLFVNLKFYENLDDTSTTTYQFIFNEDNISNEDTSNYPTISFKNDFKIKVLRGITNAGLSVSSATVENSETVPVTLTITTDNSDALAHNLNDFVKVYLNGEQLSNEEVDALLIRRGETSIFDCTFEYEKVQLTEPVVQNYLFKIYNENNQLVNNKILTFTITWVPTEISSIDALHYLDRQNYTTSTGVGEATNEIGSGRMGVLKITVNPDYADYDYIIISSSEAESDRVTFTQLVNKDNVTTLESTQQYSTYLDDGSVMVDKSSAVDGVYYFSTLIAAGIAEGTEYTITIKAYKNGSDTSVGTGFIVLSASFAPYVNMSLDSQFTDNAVARGSLATIKVNGITNNSTIEFSLSGITSGNSAEILARTVLKDATTLGIPTYTAQTGTTSFDLSLYIGLLAATSNNNGYFTITATVTSVVDGALVITTSTITLYLVDYLITDISADGANNNVLKAVIQYGYTPLKLAYTTTLGNSKDALSNFKQFTGSTDETSFSTAFNLLMSSITSDVATINSWGVNTTWSMWYYNNIQLSASSTYTNFYVGKGEDSLGVKGKKEVDLAFYGELARCYVLVNGVYETQFATDFVDFSDYLSGATYLYSYDFTVSFQNFSSTDEPEQITTQQELANMVENGHYILMNDITLTNWVPLTTKIGSLDGNGYVLYLNNFKLTTKNDNGGSVSSINVGLFEKISTFTNGQTNETESTRLTNLIIDISRTTWTDLTGIATVNFGFIVGINDGGIIYNCEIINTVTNQGLDGNSNGSWLSYYSTDSNKIALQNNYLYANSVFLQLETQAEQDAKATIVSTFIFVSSSIGGTATDVNIGGLVGQNTGYITNSRVGRVDSKIGKATATYYGINIFGGGALGGLVGRNTGTISSSYFANGSLVNFSGIINEKTITGGLVAYNTGSINTSYVEGVQYKEIPIITNSLYEVVINGTTYSITLFKGSGVLKIGDTVVNTIAQNKFTLTYEANGETTITEYTIKDDKLFYGTTNIPMVNNGVVNNVTIDNVTYQLIVNKSGVGSLKIEETVIAYIADNSFTLNNVEYTIDNGKLSYTIDKIRTTSGAIYFNGTVGGFVHTNYGDIENCYSNININSSLGVGGFAYNNASENSSIKYSYTASVINLSSNITGAFIGVDRELNVLNSGLIESCYYLQDNQVSLDENDPASALSGDFLTYETGEYLVGFVFDKNGVWKINTTLSKAPSLVQADNIAYSNREPASSTDLLLSYKSNYLPGTQGNPIIIYNTSTFNGVFKSTENSNENSEYIRLVADIDFAGNSPEYSSILTFTGDLQGNGMSIENLVLLSENSSTTYFGLFQQINGEAVVSNLTLTVNQISGTQSYAVGGLAGIISNASVNNINIIGANDQASISGYNVTGGLAGIITGVSTKIFNIESSISIYSTYDVAVGILEKYYAYSDSGTQNDISYAGGIAGVVALQSNFNTNKTNPNIVNCVTYGDLTINAEIVGGVFGLIDSNTVVSSAKFITNNYTSMQQLKASSIAGGLAGENRGLLIYSYIAMEDNLQTISDRALSTYADITKQTSTSDLFTGTPKVIGGLVGLNVGTSGENVTIKTGSIEYCYSRINVVNTSAKVAGGLIGVAITNLNQLSNGISSLITQTTKTTYSTRADDPETTENEATDNAFETSSSNFSAYINNVYNTGNVSSLTTAGGLVGIATAPINTDYSSAIIATLSGTVLTASTATVYKGSIAGKILYDVYNSVGTNISDILFVDESNSAIDASVVVTDTVNSGTTTDVLVGNASNVYDPRIADTVDYTLGGIASSTSKIQNTFSNFKSVTDAEKWAFDDTLEGNIFPRLTIGKTVVIQTISSVDEFFTYIKGGQGGNYQITQDLTFDLSNENVATSLSNLSSEEMPISGAIQGYGTDGTAITITVLYDGDAVSFLGYVSSLSLSNINFVFNGNATTSSEYFGLIANKANNSYFTNISVTTKVDETQYAITVNANKAFGGMVGLSTRCAYKNSSTDVKFVNSQYSTNGSLSAGGLFGQGAERNTVNSVDVNVDIELITTDDDNIYVGGIFGIATGDNSISGYGENRISINGILNINSKGVTYIGGVSGYIDAETSSCSIGKLDNSIVSNVKSTKNVYVGGIVGYANKVILDDIAVISGSMITIESQANVYAGGIGGEYENYIEITSYSVSAEKTFTNCASDVNITINNTTTNSNEIYVGGLFGLVWNNVVETGSKSIETDIYVDNYASGNIQINSTNNSTNGTLLLYAGGLFGKVYNYSSEEEYLGVLPRISISANDVNIILNDLSSVSSVDLLTVYMGGIAGYSSMNIAKCINYGMISANCLGNNTTLYMGGIVGYTRAPISTCLSIGEVVYSGISSATVQAIVGYTGSQTVLNCYYNSDLTGMLQDTYILTEKSITNIQSFTLNQMFETNSSITGFDLTFGDNSYFDDNNVYKCLPYIDAIKSLMNLSYFDDEGASVINTNTNVLIKEINDSTSLSNEFINNSNPYKSVILTADMTINSLTIGNVSRVIGNGKTVTTSYQVFTAIPTNCLVSGLVIVASADIDVTLSGTSLVYGALAPTNNGIVSNCVIGGLPTYTNNSSTIAFNSVGLSDKIIGSNDNVFTINLTATVNNATQIYVGSLIGQNNNIVTNSWCYLDLNVNISGAVVGACYVGNLVGYNTAIMDYCYAMGKLTVENLVIKNSSDTTSAYVGGLLGYSTTTLSQLVGMVDISSATNIGGVLGCGNVGSGVIYTTDMSRTSGIVATNVGTGTAANFSVDNLLGNKVIGAVGLGLNADIWKRDSTLNYGLPCLKTTIIMDSDLQDIRFTGDGDTTSPYEICNYALLTKFASSSATGYYSLTRDLSAKSSMGDGDLVYATLNGNGFIIFIDNLSALGNSNTYSIFNIILKLNGTLNGIMVKVNNEVSSLSTGSTSASIAPLLFKNSGGTVQNCAVVGTFAVANGKGTVGGMISQNVQGTVQNCWTDVNITAENGAYNVGGLIGTMGSDGLNSTLKTSFASGSIALSNCTNSVAGGLVGKATGMKNGASSCTIYSCYFSGITTSGGTVGTISASGTKTYFGAFVGTFGSIPTNLNEPDEDYAIDKLLLTDCYFAGAFYSAGADSSYQVDNSNIVVGYANITGAYENMFTTVIIQKEELFSVSNYWAIYKTPSLLGRLNTILSTTFTFGTQNQKPYLANVTPHDRIESLV